MTIMQKLGNDTKVAYLTPAETMAALSISRRTLDRYVEAGKLRPSRLPSGHRRFATSAVEALLSNEPWEPAP